MKKTFSILTAVFVVLTFLVSCGGGEPGSIYGIVIDSATGLMWQKEYATDNLQRYVHDYSKTNNYYVRCVR